MRIFFDTNTLVSAVRFEGNERRLHRLASSRTMAVTAEFVLEELFDVLCNKFRFLPADAAAEVERFRPTLLQVTQTAKEPGLAPDEHILRDALESDADFLVTGDRRLLHRHTYGRVAIVRTVDALRTLGVEP